MSTIMKHIVPYYPPSVATNTTEFTERDFEGVLQEIRTSRLLRDTCGRIRALSDQTERAAVKQAELPFILPHGFHVPTRKKPDFQRHTGLLLFDVDHVADAPALKAEIVKDPQTAFAFLSPSGDGVKFGCFTTAHDAATHEAAWSSASAYYSERFQVEIDPAPRATNAACFLSFDAEAYHNPEAAPVEATAPAPKCEQRVLPGATLEAAIADLDPVDQGDKYEVRCPKCGRHEAYVYKTGDARVRCAHKDSCAYVGPPLVQDFHLTDDGNAQRLLLLHGSELLYCNGRRKRWYCWDGVRFQEDRVGRVHFLARDVPGHVKAEADAMPISEATQLQRKRLYAHSIVSESANRLKAMVERAAFDPRVAIIADMLDRDPWRLCVRNGYLDLRTGNLEPPDPERLITRQAAVTFDPAAKCPRWIDLIDKATCGRKLLAEFLQMVLGYCLTGETFEDKFFLFVGAGANGKSTVLETIAALLGDYAVTPPQGTFLSRRYNNPSGASPELALLQGARLATMTETEAGDRLAMGLLKRLASGGKGTARDLFAGLEADTPSVKIVIDSNHAPRITGSDHGTWRRVCRVPFDFKFQGAELVPDFRAKMVRDAYGEHSGILNWLLEGCLRWQAAGTLEPPEDVQKATDQYRDAEDPVKRFLEERTTAGDGFSARAGLLYEAFKEWAAANGEPIQLSSVAFASELAGRGFRKIKTKRGLSYRGLALNEEQIQDDDKGERGEF